MDKENTLNMVGIEYPMSLKDTDKFEKQNPTISITVLGYEGKSVYPLRNSDNTDREHNIILMLIEKDGVKHYCLVKSLSRLLSSQVSKKDGKKYFCLRCLNPFNNQEALDKHKEYCSKYESVKIQLPKKETMVKFKNHHRSEKVPTVIYADFECLNKSIQTCVPDPERSYTKRYQKHEPNCFCYYIKHINKEFPLRKYIGENAAEVFVKMLEEDIKMINNIPMKKMIFGEEERKQYEKENICWICKEEFDDMPNENGYKKIKKLGIIVILLVSIEELHITYVILNIENQILRLWYFIILMAMIVIYL